MSEHIVQTLAALAVSAAHDRPDVDERLADVRQAVADGPPFDQVPLLTPEFVGKLLKTGVEGLRLVRSINEILTEIRKVRG